MSLSPFDGPIPGQSLTAEPKSRPWENPPMMSDPMEVLQMYMERLANEETLDDVMDMLDIGIPVDTVSGALLSMGITEGYHSIDIKLFVRPLLTAHIKALADVVGVEYKMTIEEYDDKDAKAKQRRKAKLEAKLAMQTGKIIPEKADEGEQLMMETQEELVAPQEEQAPAEEMPVGLMARGQ